MFLTENSVPTWSLYVAERAEFRNAHASWVPERPETILEDAFLMMAFYVAKVPDIVRSLGQYIKTTKKRTDIREAVSADELNDLRAVCRKTDFIHDHRIKLVICAYSDSDIHSQLECVRQYSFECDVLVPKFSRHCSMWHKELQINDELGT